MAGMPEKIDKAPILKRLDELSERQRQRRVFLRDLENWTNKPDFVGILVDHGVVKPGNTPRDEEYHLRNHWYDENGQGWWKNNPMQQHLPGITRWGLIYAFRKAVELRLPVYSYWLCSSNDFHTYVTWNDEEVTRILLTPPPEGPDLPPNLLVQEQSILVIRPANGPQPEPFEIERHGAIAIISPKTLQYD